MTNTNLGRWLLVAIAIVGLAFAAPVVSAHGEEPTQGNETTVAETPADGDATGWAAAMDDQMAPGTVAEMESHMGVSVDEMAPEMAEHDYNARGMAGQGYDC